MRAVTAASTFPGSVHEAESVWYDTDRWAEFVDGLERVERVTSGWPGAGAEISWRSGPAGRGHVTERVVDHQPLQGQSLEVEDDSIRGRQQIGFTPEDGSVAVALTLEYELKNSSLMTPLVDLLFIRRAMTTSLETTLRRFGTELQAARAQDVR
jgi:Polyketide cyclase / dehydrase and lipid transport